MTIFSEPFFQRALIAGLGIAAVAGPIGCFIVWRRMAYFGDATAHAAVLGVALALATDLPIGLGTLVVALAMAVTVVGLSARGWAWYDRASDEAHRRAFRLLTDLKAALRAEDQLELHFQPKVALGTDACSSTEALLRWTHPEFGPVSPGEFVPLVERTAPRLRREISTVLSLPSVLMPSKK